MSVALVVFVIVLIAGVLALDHFLAERAARRARTITPPKFRLIQSVLPPPGERFWQWDVLTEREVEIVEMVIDGKRNAEIAKALFLGTGTVANHLQNIYRKLGVHSRVELIRAVRDHIR
jgi:DNA-binding NarL/FixJ family response regulator